MARRPIDPTGPATGTLTLRLSEQDRNLLDRLVADRAVELAREGIEVTAASYVRGLIRKEADAKGFADERPDAGRAPPAKGKRAAAKPAKGTKAGEDTADNVRAALLRALTGGALQAEIGRQAGIDSGQLSRFKAGKAGLSPEALAKLGAVVRSR